MYPRSFETTDKSSMLVNLTLRWHDGKGLDYTTYNFLYFIPNKVPLKKFIEDVKNTFGQYPPELTAIQKGYKLDPTEKIELDEVRLASFVEYNSEKVN